MANKKSTIYAELEFSDRFSKPFKRTTDYFSKKSFELSKILNNFDNSNFGGGILRFLGVLNKGIRGTGRLLKSVFKGVGVGIAAAVAGAYAFKRFLVDGSAQSEVTRNKLLLSNQGNREKTDKEIAAAKRFASKTMFSDNETIDTIVNLKISQVKDEDMESTLMALADSATKWGKPLTEAISVFQGGVVQGKVERLDNFGIEAHKVSGGVKGQKLREFNYTNHKGQKVKATLDIDSKTWSKDLAFMLSDANKGAVDANKNSWKVQESNFFAGLARLRDYFMLDGGVLEAISKKLGIFNGALGNSELVKNITELGKSFAEWVNGINIEKFIEGTKKFLSVTLPKIFNGLMILAQIVMWVADKLGWMLGSSKPRKMSSSGRRKRRKSPVQNKSLKDALGIEFAPRKSLSGKNRGSMNNTTVNVNVHADKNVDTEVVQDDKVVHKRRSRGGSRHE